MAMGGPGVGNERRRYPRLEKSMSVVLLDPLERVLDGSPNLRNVSAHGFGIETTAQLAAGEKFKFLIDVPGQGPINGTARVQWIIQPPHGRTYEFGAEIVDLGWTQTSKLQKYLHPSVLRRSGWLDHVLMGAVAVVGILVLHDLMRTNPQMFAGLAENVSETFPQFAVIGGALVGIYLCLKR